MVEQNRSYFRRQSNDVLEGAIKDILDAIAVSRQWDDWGVGESKYLDQLHVALAERNRRTEKNVCQSCKRPL